ncbi:MULTISPECIES: cyanophycinase [unclassified Duganella]|uniref:cyanophycinase n=1 Tax=unclassified Duganella TaxID=2636909 RepID=UPI000E346299|nr:MULTISPECIES: cyanophycinase [unclassified Duganella]RFP19349.1 cyanophycinase [Duganella sp. BJB475]RFP35930.1 cyanophycinase [Duganella sp. BJB476]
MKRLLGLLLASLFWCAQVGAAEVAPQGSLVIVGGALRADNAVVWQRVVQLAGGAGARIAVLPSAAANPERSGANLAKYLNRYGASAFVVPVSVNLKDRDYRRDAEDEALAGEIRAAGGVYFTGGDQALITQALVRPDGSRTAVLDAIWDVYRRGGVIAGSSAGAAIMSSTMYYNAKTVFGTLAQGVNDGRELAPGLGFVGSDVFVDQHLLARGRFARMLPAMLKKGYKLGLGIDENTAMVINSAREVEVLGYQGALLLDLSQAATDGGKDFNISNVRISYLDRGDRYNLRTGQFTPSADKVDGKVDPQKPAMTEPVYSADILGHNAVLVMMEKLIDNSQTEAIGIATAAPGQPRQDLGFEFKFSRLADSVGYASASSEAYSILNLRLDVRPLQITRPWYK